MGIDSWVEQELRLAGPCPECGSQDVRPIAYGMPDPEAYHRLQDVVDFAGCTLPDHAPRFSCGRCRHTWGRREL